MTKKFSKKNKKDKKGKKEKKMFYMFKLLGTNHNYGAFFKNYTTHVNKTELDFYGGYNYNDKTYNFNWYLDTCENYLNKHSYGVKLDGNIWIFNYDILFNLAKNDSIYTEAKIDCDLRKCFKCKINPFVNYSDYFNENEFDTKIYIGADISKKIEAVNIGTKVSSMIYGKNNLTNNTTKDVTGFSIIPYIETEYKGCDTFTAYSGYEFRTDYIGDNNTNFDNFQLGLNIKNN